MWYETTSVAIYANPARLGGLVFQENKRVNIIAMENGCIVIGSSERPRDK